MKQFDYENLVKNLPDYYAKDKNSNNYKILHTDNRLLDNLQTDIQAISDMLDIEKATGKILDMYGEMYNQPRGLATDAQYRMMIKSKVLQNVSGGDHKSVVNAICTTFGCEPSEVAIKEGEKAGTVEMVRLPLNAIITTGFSLAQVVTLIERLLPAGVRAETVLTEGTFECGETEEEYDENAGFAISEENQSIGGYLGHITGDVNEEILPIK